MSESASVCAICRQDNITATCSAEFHISCECPITFPCCGNVFHTQCVRKLADSSALSIIIGITKCPLCRRMVDHDALMTVSNEEYVEELETVVVENYDKYIKLKKVNDELMKQVDNISDEHEDLLKKYDNKMKFFLEEQKEDMEKMLNVRKSLIGSLQKAIKLVSELISKNKILIYDKEILLAEKEGIINALYYKYNVYKSDFNDTNSKLDDIYKSINLQGTNNQRNDSDNQHNDKHAVASPLHFDENITNN